MPRPPVPRRRAGTRDGSQPLRVTLPAMTPTEAGQLLDILDRLTAALWRTHGAALSDYAIARGRELPRPRGARWVGRRGPTPADDDW